jgi:hypothetical protein
MEEVNGLVEQLATRMDRGEAERERKNMLSSIKGVMVDDHTQKKISPSEKKWHPRLYSRVILFSSCDNLP